MRPAWAPVSLVCMSFLDAAPRAAESIHLVSWAGWPNFGDELIAARWLRFLAEHRPEAEVWLDVRHPGTVSSLLRGLHPRLHVTDTLFRALDVAEHTADRTVADLVTHLGSPHFDSGLLDLREAGTLHLLGGGYVNGYWPRNDGLVEGMRAAAEISGAKLVATGQGMMPLGAELFEGFDHVGVRDRPSARALGIERGYDDAYLLEDPPAPALDGAEPRELWVCVQSDALDPDAFERLIAWTREQIRALGFPRERVRYVEAIPGDDYAGYERLKDLIAEDGFLPFTAFWRDGFDFGPHQVWLSTRFHHHPVGALHGARGIALNGHGGYYDVKHESLRDLGTRWLLSDGDPSRLHRLEELRRPADFSAICAAKVQEARSIYR